MAKFFVDLQQSIISAKKVVSWEEEAKEALAMIEQALNIAPADLNNPGRMSQLKDAFHVLLSLDDGSIQLTSAQKADLLSMEQNFTSLLQRASNTVKDLKLFTQKELMKKTLDHRMGGCLIEFEKAKGGILQNEQNIAILHERVDSLLAPIGEAKKRKESYSMKQKEIFKLSKEIKGEMDVLVKKWPEYEAKKKVAEEEEKVVGEEWSKMEQLISSLKESFIM